MMSTQPFREYLREEGRLAGRRIRAKIVAAAGFAAAGSTVWAIAGQRPINRIVPSITANTAVAVATFAVCQESVRAVRHGQHDAWSSVIAGSITGGLVTRATHGRGFHVLGIVIWGPMCGALHLVNSLIQPAELFKRVLASQGLLDLPEQPMQQQQQQPLPQPELAAAVAEPRRLEDITDAEKNRWAQEIKERELTELRELWKRQNKMEAAAAAGLRPEQQYQEQQQEGSRSGRRWWSLFG